MIISNAASELTIHRFLIVSSEITNPWYIENFTWVCKRTWPQGFFNDTKSSLIFLISFYWTNLASGLFLIQPIHNQVDLTLIFLFSSLVAPLFALWVIIYFLTLLFTIPLFLGRGTLERILDVPYWGSWQMFSHFSILTAFLFSSPLLNLLRSSITRLATLLTSNQTISIW